MAKDEIIRGLEKKNQRLNLNYCIILANRPTFSTFDIDNRKHTQPATLFSLSLALYHTHDENKYFVQSSNCQKNSLIEVIRYSFENIIETVTLIPRQLSSCILLIFVRNSAGERDRTMQIFIVQII